MFLTTIETLEDSIAITAITAGIATDLDSLSSSPMEVDMDTITTTLTVTIVMVTTIIPLITTITTVMVTATELIITTVEDMVAMFTAHHHGVAGHIQELLHQQVLTLEQEEVVQELRMM